MIFNFLSFRTTLHSVDYLNFLYFEFFFLFSFQFNHHDFFNASERTSTIQRNKKTEYLRFNQKIDDSERFLDIYMITTVFDFTKSNFIMILISIDIFNFSKLKRAIFEQSARFWKTLKFFEKIKTKASISFVLETIAKNT